MRVDPVWRSAGRKLTSWFAALAAVCALFPASALAVDLVSRGSTWRYLDDGSNQGTAWRAPGFDDDGWASGPAQLGYGDGDEATVVSGGPAGNRRATTYFRIDFSVADLTSIGVLTLGILRDDGAIVYLNGTEVYRINMPSGSVAYDTFASSAIGGSAESTFNETSVLPGLLQSGNNVIAVEIHQAGPTSSDISFDLELVSTPPSGVPGLVRSPYLQKGTPTSMTVRWRTDTFTDTRLAHGLSPETLTTIHSDATLRTEHEVLISDLDPDTRYYYEVGNASLTFAGGDADHFFNTSPLAGTQRPTRIWVIGDSGHCAVSQTGCNDATAVMNQYLAWVANNGGNLADLVLMLGDNAYNDGSDTEYTTGLFEVFANVLRNHVLWPVPGNHEFGFSDSPSQTGPYYEAFVLPTAGEAGGLASGTEAYYAFDFANIHFVALDSHDTSRAAPVNPETNVCPGGGGGGAMYDWLCADLAANDRDWTISLWHHPAYTKGSHDSDLEAQLEEMREKFNPVIEFHGVDLNFTGHSHSYERSILLDGHYGVSSSFDPTLHAKDSGDGNPAGDGAYEKPFLGPDPHEGLVYSVVGSSSKNSGELTLHPIMASAENIEGSLILDIDANQVDGYFIDLSGVQRDHFRIVKGTASVCGNGNAEPGEQCDDGNTLPGDCCSVTCQYEVDGSTCSDGAFCTTGETCSSGTCGGGLSTDCSSSADQCNAGICNEATDSCDAVPANEGSSCSDGAFCTTGETCSAGLCEGGSPRLVDDEIDCTTDSCDEANDVVVNAVDHDSCDDSSFCNGAETCSALSGCEPGSPPCEDDLDVCTADSCDEVLGCIHEPIADCSVPLPAFSKSGRAVLVLVLAFAVVWFGFYRRTRHRWGTGGN